MLYFGNLPNVQADINNIINHAKYLSSSNQFYFVGSANKLILTTTGTTTYTKNVGIAFLVGTTSSNIDLSISLNWNSNNKFSFSSLTMIASVVSSIS